HSITTVIHCTRSMILPLRSFFFSSRRRHTRSKRDWSSDVCSSDLEVTVPEGKLWMMGDNRSASGDSRAHLDGPNEGFVNIDQVVGRAEIIAWPLDRWGSAGSNNAPFEQVPEP